MAGREAGAIVGGAVRGGGGGALLARVVGVRHLSPTSAWHVKQVLDEVQPTAVLVEAPFDATDLTEHFTRPETAPPIAILGFTLQPPVKTLLVPLTVYSPEWVAATWARRHERLVRFIDLPVSALLEVGAKRFVASEQRGGGPGLDPLLGEHDAFDALASVLGAPDHETWWERSFERGHDARALGEAIAAHGERLRGEVDEGDPSHREMLLREAHMRRVIRATLAEGHAPDRVVVVCGAMHAPTLRSDLPVLSDDELSSLMRHEASLTLMPYSYTRMSSVGGDGVAHHAPRYFEMHWRELEASGDASGLTVSYMAELARRLRVERSAGSTAHVIEAVRLAQALAVLRQGHLPTLRDLRDAAIVNLADGDATAIAPHLGAIEIGSAVGSLPPNVARTSLQLDFQRLVKELQLEPNFRYEWNTAVVGRYKGGALDLRKDPKATSTASALRDRRVSIFLNRLCTLGVPCARDLTRSEDRARSPHVERWEAGWKPESEMRLAECSALGVNVEVATLRRLAELLHATDRVATVAGLVETAVKCDLPVSVEAARARLSELSVGCDDFVETIEVLVRIAAIAWYETTVTDVDLRPLRPLVGQLFLRASLRAIKAARCTNDAAKRVADGLTRMAWVAGFEDDPAHDGDVPDELRWSSAVSSGRLAPVLEGVADDPLAHPYVAGAACALLLERGLCPDEAVERRMLRSLSPGLPAARVALFFEGFASINHMALLSRESLLIAFDHYVQGLDERQFRKALVGLRRAFASFGTREVRRIVEVLCASWGLHAPPRPSRRDPERAQAEVDQLNEALDALGDLSL